MKHLISLAMKYISRQKMRTLITFLCVTLSVFILCAFGAFCGSIMKTMVNTEKNGYGSWEAEISSWTDYSNTEKTKDILENHVAVDKYLLSYTEYSENVTDRRQNDGKIGFFVFSDGKNTKYFSSVDSTSIDGDIQLPPPYYYDYSSYPTKYADGVYVPEFLEEMGYSVGDTVDFTLQYVNAEYDENSDIIKKVRQQVKEEKGLAIVGDDSEYAELSGDDISKADKSTMYSLLRTEGYSLDEMPLVITSEGNECRFSFKIAGFCGLGDGFEILRNGNASPVFYDLFCNNVMINSSHNAYVTIKQDMDFDDGIHLLGEAFGIDENEYLQYPPEINTYILSLEMRSADAITQNIGLFVAILFFLFLFWAVARFVIDNAFEISAKERSTQYAALRIMGASKVQIAAVVLTEAVFYIITAVPVGALTAYLFCRFSFESFRKSGLENFEFYVNPIITVIAIVLCIIAILISAYSSSMWATRKLNPAEALNFGKPKSKNKKIRRHKSKLNLNSKRFISRYTRKNIMRSKSRFIISTVTMTIGVMLFSLSAIAGVVALTYLNSENLSTGSDYTLEYNSISPLEKASETFYDNDNFSDAELICTAGFPLGRDSDELCDVLNSHMKYKSFGNNDHTYSNYLNVYFADRITYSKHFESVTELSYDEFLKTGGGLVYSSPYGDSYQQSKKEVLYEKSFTMLDKTETINLNAPYYSGFELNIVGEVCCEYIPFMTNGIIFPADSPLQIKMMPYLQIRLTVNGEKNLDNALEIINDFKDKYPASSYWDTYFTNTGLNDFVKSIVRMIAVLVVAIWLVGILSMINSIITSVMNRSRELMMLRSVGMTKKQLRKSVFLECLMFSSVSSVAGVILSILATFSYVSIFMGAFEELTSNATLLLRVVFGILIVSAVIIVLNLIISILAAIPGIRRLEKAETLTRAE